MKKCARLVALALILVMLLTACGQIPYVTAAASETVMPMAFVEKDNVSITEIVLQILFHEPLIEQGEIKVHYISDHDKASLLEALDIATRKRLAEVMEKAKAHEESQKSPGSILLGCVYQPLCPQHP